MKKLFCCIFMWSALAFSPSHAIDENNQRRLSRQVVEDWQRSRSAIKSILYDISESWDEAAFRHLQDSLRDDMGREALITDPEHHNIRLNLQWGNYADLVSCLLNLPIETKDRLLVFLGCGDRPQDIDIELILFANMATRNAIAENEAAVRQAAPAFGIELPPLD